MHSVIANGKLLTEMRLSSGWTQSEAGVRAGYSDRVIRKLERGESVRWQTLVDVLGCYHEAANILDWDVSRFIEAPHKETEVLNVAHEGSVSFESNKSKISEYFDLVYNGRKVDLIDRYIDNEALLIAEGDSQRGIEAFRNRAVSILQAFDPIYFVMGKMHGYGSEIFYCWNARMRQSGPFLDMPASNRWVESRGHSRAIFRRGKVIEGEDHWDIDSVIRQIKGENARMI